MIRYSEIPEIVLGDIPELNIPELAVTYSRKKQKGFGKITSSSDAAKIIKEIFPAGEIELQEQFIVYILTRPMKLLDITNIPKGLSTQR